MLGNCGSLIHGTRGFGSQIGKHLGIENYLNYEANSEFSNINKLLIIICNYEPCVGNWGTIKNLTVYWVKV